MTNKFLKLSFIANIIGIVCCIIGFSYLTSLSSQTVTMVRLFIIVGLCLFSFGCIIGVVSLMKERKKWGWVSIIISIIAILLSIWYIQIINKAMPTLKVSEELYELIKPGLEQQNQE